MRPVNPLRNLQLTAGPVPLLLLLAGAAALAGPPVGRAAAGTGPEITSPAGRGEGRAAVATALVVRTGEAASPQA